ncbi:hypothetical protein ACLOJK_010351 [Asimina triloba]
MAFIQPAPKRAMPILRLERVVPKSANHASVSIPKDEKARRKATSPMADPPSSFSTSLSTIVAAAALKPAKSSAQMDSPSFLYETLAPLSTSADSDTDSAEPYSVFRNHISTPSSIPHHAAAPDYFSLESGQDSFASPEPAPLPQPPEPGPSSSFQENPSLERAWFRSDCRFKSPMLQLHKGKMFFPLLRITDKISLHAISSPQILDFSDFVSPTEEEQANRAFAVQRVFEVVRYIWPHCKVEVFGSFKTGLYLPTSDIDVVILDSKVRTPQIGLQALSKALSQKGIAKKIQVIAKARVPIVKFIERSSGVAFDIRFPMLLWFLKPPNMECNEVQIVIKHSGLRVVNSFDVHNGPKAAEFIKFQRKFYVPTEATETCQLIFPESTFLELTHLKDAVTKIPPLRPLCLILKVFLQQRELNEVYSGGIGSYALLAMLIAHLKVAEGSLKKWGNGHDCKLPKPKKSKQFPNDEFNSSALRSGKKNTGFDINDMDTYVS